MHGFDTRLRWYEVWEARGPTKSYIHVLSLTPSRNLHNTLIIQTPNLGIPRRWGCPAQHRPASTKVRFFVPVEEC